MAEHGFEHHQHDAMVHDHEHWHVTHNWSDTAMTFAHLASKHAHEHDHAQIDHAHVPHLDFESEHAGEAHIHDHDDPVDRDANSATEAPAKSTAKKSAAKKATRKRAPAKKADAT